MPRDANGNYTNANAPVDAGTNILASVYNTENDDKAAELTDSLSRGGKGGMLAQLKSIDGVASAPGMTFAGELNSGWYRPGAGLARFSLLGADVLSLDANGIDGTNVYKDMNGIRLGKVSVDTDLASLIASIGSVRKTVMLYPEAWDVPANLTIPENITLELPRGATISIASGVTLTMNGKFIAGPYQILSGDGAMNGLMAEALVEWFGVLFDDSTDNTTTLTKAFNWLNTAHPNYAAQSFKTLILPAGSANITGALPAVTNSKFSIRGPGSDVCRINVGGAGNYTAVQIGPDLPTAVPTYNMSLSGFALFQTGSGTVTLLKINSAWWSRFEDLLLYGIGGAGETSVALDYSGHTENEFNNVVCRGPKPILMRRSDSTDATDGVDHTNFNNISLYSTNDEHPLVEVVTPCVISNMSWTGRQAWVGGSAGFEYIDTTGTVSSGGWAFHNIRRESGTGFGIDIEMNTASNTLAHLLVDNCRIGDTTRDGIKLRGVVEATFRNWMTGGAGQTQLDVQALDNLYRVTFDSCNLVTADITLTDYELVYSSSNEESTTVFPKHAVYKYTVPATTRGMAINDGQLAITKDEALANDGTRILAGSTTSEGFALVTASAGGGTVESGLFALSNGSTTKVSGTANTSVTDVAGNLVVVWNAGSSRYEIRNRLGDARDVSALVLWA